MCLFFCDHSSASVRNVRITFGECKNYVMASILFCLGFEGFHYFPAGVFLKEFFCDSVCSSFYPIAFQKSPGLRLLFKIISQ